ncbi:MAG: HepT-like ribonuclease domain-containing protein [Desulfobacterales bacterium]
MLKYSEKNKLLQDGILRQMEIVGEACRNISDEQRDLHPEVPWYEIIGLRNRLVHAYFSISIEIIWEVVVNDLDTLSENVGKILKEMEQRAQ